MPQMKYIIVDANSISELTNMVNNHIRQHDFVPQGGVNSELVGNSTYYQQAMVKIIKPTK